MWYHTHIKPKRNILGKTDLKKLIEVYKTKSTPKMPISAEMIMKKFNIPEGKELGLKQKYIMIRIEKTIDCENNKIIFTNNNLSFIF